jgi:hypothetical protein
MTQNILKPYHYLIVAGCIFIAILLFLSHDNLRMGDDAILNSSLIHFFSYGILTIFIYLGFSLDILVRIGLTLFIAIGLSLFHELVRNIFSNELIGFEMSTADYFLMNCLGSVTFVTVMSIFDVFFFERADDQSYEYD